MAKSRVQLHDNNFYYMASSTSRQDEPNRMLWLANWVGKMELPVSSLLGTIYPVWQEKFHQKPNKSFIDHAFSVKMAGYWPRSFFCKLMDYDSISVHKKKNLINIQPPWIHTCSISHIHSGESARLPPMWPSFDSGMESCVPCSEGFSLGSLVFLPPQIQPGQGTCMKTS